MVRSVITIALTLLCVTNLFSAATDGPYVFYKGSKVVVKTITSSGLTTDEYSESEDITLSCYVSSTGDKFTFPLRKNHSTTQGTLPAPTKILATSDLEGNFRGLKNLLIAAKVVDNNLNWIYGSGHLVMPGDLFDRGEEVTESFWLLYKLEAEAAAAGGGVHYLIGNHDLWNLTGEYKDVEPKYMTSASIIGEGSYGSLFAENTELGKWLRKRNTIMRFGDYCFVHAGISPTIASRGVGIDEINSVMQKKLVGVNTSNTDLVTTTLGPLWYRGYWKAGSGGGGSYNKATSSEVSQVMKFLKSTRIFVGHTKQDYMSLSYNGQVIGIDIYGNHGSSSIEAFLYENGKGYSFKSNTGTKKLLFTDEVTPVGYTLTANSSNGAIKLSPAKESYDDGETVTLTVTPKAGFEFSHWEGDLTGTENPAEIVMTGDKSVSAVCTEVSGFSVTVTAPDGTVKIVPSKEFYEEGETVQLYPASQNVKQFTGWGGDTASFRDTLTFTVNRDRVISAYFHDQPLVNDPIHGIARGNRAKLADLQESFYGYGYDGGSVDTANLRTDSSIYIEYQIPAQPDDKTWPGIGLTSYVIQSLEGMSHVRLTYRSSETLYAEIKDTVNAPWILEIPAQTEWATIEIPVEDFAVAADWGMPVADFDLSVMDHFVLAPKVDAASAHSGSIEVAGLWLIGVGENNIPTAVTEINGTVGRFSYAVINRTLQFSFPSAKAVKVELFSLNGKQLFSQLVPAGELRAVQIPSHIASGVSIVRFSDGAVTKSKQLIIK